MITYLSSPGSQMHAHALSGMPVLISFGCWSEWLSSYVPSFGRVLVDSGAFSEFNSGKKIEQDPYLSWAERWRGKVDGIAAVDDIRGDWRNGIKRWLEARDWTFPTYHESDPPEALDEILSHDPSMIGLGGLPPRRNATADWLTRTWPRIPRDLPVHGWAMRWHPQWPWRSIDSTNWILDSQKLTRDLYWLTPAECVELVVKRYQREKHARKVDPWNTDQTTFGL